MHLITLVHLRSMLLQLGRGRTRLKVLPKGPKYPQHMGCVGLLYERGTATYGFGVDTLRLGTWTLRVLLQKHPKTSSSSFLKDPLNHTIGAIYHMLLQFQHGK